ncbi:MAG: nickel-dependent hydrogenase large subunit [Myxococcota bacterium]
MASSWYTESTPLPPAEGVTIPDMNRSGAYSWSKAPRLDGAVFEVGPLARAVVAGTDPGGRGVWARYRARRQESSLIAEKMAVWLNALEAGKPGIEKLPDVPASGTGQGLSEAPRGSLGHWLTIEGGRISRYHVISPTTWNGSPRDEQGQPGAMERSLKGVSIADPKDPIEALRVIHSFDPCLQCAVH